MVEELVRGVDLHDLAAVHEDDAVRDLTRKAHLMRHDRHGHAALGKLLHHVQHFADHFGVQGGGGLVKEHHLGLHGESPDNGDTLLLAAGEHRGIGARLVGKPDALEQLHGRLVGLLLGFELEADGRQRDVFLDRHVGEKVEMLEHHAHFPAVLVQVDLLVGDIHAVHDHLAGGRDLQKIQAAQHRGFAGAGGADDRDHFAAVD